MTSLLSHRQQISLDEKRGWREKEVTELGLVLEGLSTRGSVNNEGSILGFSKTRIYFIFV